MSFARIIIDHTDEEAQILNNYGVDDLKFLIKHFEVPLLSANADLDKIMTEFNDLKFAIQNEAYRNISSIPFWPSLYRDSYTEYKNVLLLVELLLCIPISTAVVE